MQYVWGLLPCHVVLGALGHEEHALTCSYSDYPTQGRRAEGNYGDNSVVLEVWKPRVVYFVKK